jgi:hypothetical protein
MSVTLADRAAADLHAMIVQHAAAGPLSGVEAEVDVVSGRALRITLVRLPVGAVQRTPCGLAPTIQGARITDLLHLLAQRACTRARICHKAEFRIRPAALAAAAIDSPDLRKAS